MAAETHVLVYGNVTSPVSMAVNASPREIRKHAEDFRNAINPNDSRIITTADFREYLKGLGIESVDASADAMKQADEVHFIDVQTFGKPVNKCFLALDYLGNREYVPLTRTHKTRNGCKAGVFEFVPRGLKGPIGIYSGCQKGNKCTCVEEFAREDSIKNSLLGYGILADASGIIYTRGFDPILD